MFYHYINPRTNLSKIKDSRINKLLQPFYVDSSGDLYFCFLCFFVVYFLSWRKINFTSNNWKETSSSAENKSRGQKRNSELHKESWNGYKWTRTIRGTHLLTRYGSRRNKTQIFCTQLQISGSSAVNLWILQQGYLNSVTKLK